MRVYFISAFALLSLHATCNAQAIGVTGVGQLPCSDFVAAERDTQIGIWNKVTSPEGKSYDGEKTKFIEWARGFISGYNSDHANSQFLTDTMMVMEVAALKYCNAHPTEEFAFAIMDFIAKGGFQSRL